MRWRIATCRIRLGDRLPRRSPRARLLRACKRVLRRASPVRISRTIRSATGGVMSAEPTPVGITSTSSAPTSSTLAAGSRQLRGHAPRGALDLEVLARRIEFGFPTWQRPRPADIPHEGGGRPPAVPGNRRVAAHELPAQARSPQLAPAMPATTDGALQAGGRGFESRTLHVKKHLICRSFNLAGASADNTGASAVRADRRSLSGYVKSGPLMSSCRSVSSAVE